MTTVKQPPYYFTAMSFFEPYIVYDSRNGREICQCSSFDDTLMMIAFDPDHRKHKRRKFILDHVVDVSSQTLEPDKQLKAQNILPDRQEEPLPAL